MKRWTVYITAITALLTLVAGCASVPESISAVEAKPPEFTTAAEKAPSTLPEEKAEEPELKETKTEPLLQEETDPLNSPAKTPQPEKKASQPTSKSVDKETEKQPGLSPEPSPTTTDPEPKSSAPSIPAPEEKPTEPPQTPATPQSSPPSQAAQHIHNYSEAVIAPSCEGGGYTKHVCTCGDSYTDNATEPLGHAYEQTGHADATTATAGYTEYTCSRCGASYRETIPQLEQAGASCADVQRVCSEVNAYISNHYTITNQRGTYMGVTWVTSPYDVQGAINSAIGTVDLYAQYYGAKSFCCGYFDDGGGSYTIVLYWDTI